MHGASYQSSAGSVERMCYIPEKIDEAAFAQFVFLRAGEAAGTEDGRMEAAPTYDQAGQYVPPQQSQSQELERRCTCCGWCTGSLERRCTCTDQAVPFCLKCKVGISEAAAADAGRPPCTDDICYTCGVAVGNKDGAARRSVRSRQGRLCLGTSTTAGLNRGSGGSCDEHSAVNRTVDNRLPMMMIRETSAMKCHCLRTSLLWRGTRQWIMQGSTFICRGVGGRAV